MKRLIILFLVFVPFVLSAQYGVDRTAGYDQKIDLGDYSAYHAGDSDELTATGDSSWTYTILVGTGDEIIFDVGMNVDSIGGTAGASNEHLFFLSYKEMPGDSWTAIGDTVSYAGIASTSNDTTFTLTSGSTAVKARYVRINCLGETDSFITQLGYLLLKIWK